MSGGCLATFRISVSESIAESTTSAVPSRLSAVASLGGASAASSPRTVASRRSGTTEASENKRRPMLFTTTNPRPPLAAGSSRRENQLAARGFERYTSTGTVESTVNEVGEGEPIAAGISLLPRWSASLLPIWEPPAPVEPKISSTRTDRHTRRIASVSIGVAHYSVNVPEWPPMVSPSSRVASMSSSACTT